MLTNNTSLQPLALSCRTLTWSSKKLQFKLNRKTSEHCNVRCAVGSLEDSDDLSEVEESEVPQWMKLLQSTTQQQWASFMELARIHNYLPSALLVLIGAWVRSDGLSKR